VSQNRSLMIILSYIGPLGIIPLLTEKNDRELQWHAKNGLAIFVAEVLLGIFISIVAMFIPDFGCSGCILNLVLFVAVVTVAILGITKGLKGERLILPVVSDFANRM
jgi:uncharacterized membrane protein